MSHAQPAAFDTIDLALLNDHQHHFPLEARPFDAIARTHGLAADEVLARYTRLAAGGALSRIGAVWAAGAGGAAALCALSVAPARLDEVAALVNRHPGVNHNYEREHAWNLWFVIAECDAAAVRATLATIEAETGLPALHLPMQRAYHIDLGFDLSGALARADSAAARAPAPRPGAPVAPADRPLAALAGEGLALVREPFAVWASAIGAATEDVLARITAWRDAATLRRFGVVVRHHDVGFGCNAMTVLDVADESADAVGAALAHQSGVTLAYRRARDRGWPYNVYFMVHGRERATVRATVRRALAAARADALPRETLFSTRRFKQTGARYFGAAPALPEGALA